MNAPAIYTLANLHTWNSIATPIRLAVIGDPVSHSLSPVMQNAALAAAGIDEHYARLHIRATELAGALKMLPGAGLIGTNLTIPHKTAALVLMDEVDSHAAKLGAINTVRVETNGKLRGFNTDGPGFVAAVREAFGVELGELRVLILGAGGGAGRALAVQCAMCGSPRLVLANRSDAKASALAAEIGAQATPWNEREAAAQEVDLLVNATSLGLKDDDPSPISSAAIKSQHLVFDTVYSRDFPTAFCRAAGAAAVDGRLLLLHQGALAFEIWFDRPAPLDAMRAVLYPTC